MENNDKKRKRGRGHIFTSEEARAAGKKGGAAVSQNREHMVNLARLGGFAKAAARRRQIDCCQEHAASEPRMVNMPPIVSTEKK